MVTMQVKKQEKTWILAIGIEIAKQNTPLYH
jgi:hypothetical protein